MSLDMFDDLPEDSGRPGSWISQLSQDDQKELEVWAQHLHKVLKMTEASARSYKSYVAQGVVRMSRGESFDSLPNDVKSGIRKYRAYRKNRK